MIRNKKLSIIESELSQTYAAASLLALALAPLLTTCGTTGCKLSIAFSVSSRMAYSYLYSYERIYAASSSRNILCFPSVRFSFSAF